MAERIVIDPITRIEGHLKIEVEVTNGVVTDAWSSGTLFRGIETILKNRSPEDAWLFTQRLCGVCTYIHGETSVRAVENAARLTIPANARIVRNLLTGGLYLHDHPVHFYHLCALDWVDVVSALKANPQVTESLAQRNITDRANHRFCRGADEAEHGRGERPAGGICQRLLGPSGLHAHAGGEPAVCRSLFVCVA